METIIEKLIELDFDEPALQNTPIILNQSNVNSVEFKYKIYKGSKEINYTDYTRATLVFRKPDGTNIAEDGAIGSSGITYTLNTHILDIPGRVIGYVSLYTSVSLASTLHYTFEIKSDLLNIKRASAFYIGRLEELIAQGAAGFEDFKAYLDSLKAQGLIASDEIDAILAGMQDKSFVTISDFNEAVSQLDDSLNDALTKIADNSSQMDNIANNISNPNILHNWDFRNPVNQRGLISYATGAGRYTIDRWMAEGNVSVSLTNQGLIVKVAASSNYFIYQKLENPAQYLGKTYTLSIKFAGDDTIYSESGSLPETMVSNVAINITTPYGEASLRLSPAMLIAALRISESLIDGAVVEAVKLERGIISTLANDPPSDYGIELAKSQRYQFVASEICRLRNSILETNTIIFFIPTPVSLRMTPVVPSTVQVANVAAVAQTGFVFTPYVASNGILLFATKTAHGLTDASLYIPKGAIFDANL